MIQLKPPVIIAILAVGALAAFIGMLDWVGYVSWGISPYASYIGIAMIVIGAVLAHLDLRRHRADFDEYESVKDLRESLADVPDDDYRLDMTGGKEAEYDTEYCDFTAEQGVKE